MEIKQLFKKPIEREIEGVIKIGQGNADHTFQELDEYVITDEIEQHLATFFAAYDHSLAQSTDQIGVWISGFFGSGKSHFLKILSYLLRQDLRIESKRPLDFFTDKLTNNPKLLAQMKQALTVPNEVALFNIESKSEADSMQQKSAVVKVFNKVFNEMRGFSGANAWIAEMEETLDSKGQYAAFKQAFADQADGLSWEEGRDEIFYNEDAAITALSEATDMSEESARHFMEAGESSYTISDESFAKRVQKYVAQQPANYHLVFMADEMGQYISENGQLMLDLQMVVEDLAQYCHGQVWVVVTSQQDIDSLKKGGMSSNDFSKIQGRFNTRLPLSSANADEVIKKRLLTKTTVAVTELAPIYTANEAILKNKITFTNDTAQMPNFANQAEFVAAYPFIPYQFNLLQKVFTGIREHGSAGKHLANGERNLLSAVQSAAISYEHEQTDILVPFDVFYKNIEDVLEHSVRLPIIQAENNPKLDDFDIKVLKLLFLIRYVKEIPANIDNLTTLLIDHIDEETLTLKEAIQKSANRLEKEFLIQRRGSEYAFLTNDEQDINREIQNVIVSNNDVVKYLGETIFTDILQLKQYRYQPFTKQPGLNYNFELNQWIDTVPIKTAHSALTLQIISPNNLAVAGDEMAAAQSLEAGKVIVMLPEQGTYMDDIMNFKRIDQYLREPNHNQTDIYADILNHKSRERTALSVDIKTQVEAALADAKVFINGAAVKASGGSLINVALKQLIEVTYNKITYVTHNYDREDLMALFSAQGDLLSAQVTDPNHLATDAIFNDVEQQAVRHIRVSLRELVDSFAQIPFGWQETTILASLIRLLNDEKIQLRVQTERLIPEDNLTHFISLITRPREQEKIVVERRVLIQERYVKAANGLMKEMYNKTMTQVKDDERMAELQDQLRHTASNLDALQRQYAGHNQYPGEQNISAELRIVKSLCEQRDANQFFECVFKQQDDLLTLHDDNELVKQFFANQVEIFNAALSINTKYQRDCDYLTTATAKQAGQRIAEILSFAEPYSLIKELPELIKNYKEAIFTEIENTAAPIKQELAHDQVNMEATLTNAELKQKIKPQIEQQYRDLNRQLDDAGTIADVRGVMADKDITKGRFITLINKAQRELAARVVPIQPLPPKPTTGAGSDTYGNGKIAETPPEPVAPKVNILARTAVLPDQQVVIHNQAELDAYLAKVQQHLQQELQGMDELRIM
ncbi:BREX system P-loop protein BrxC [Loigolactobacillus jiayinensis]|uniref:BREX system P-loop protein BrxC n=1 Tax=Loigolactobacillus jiayinensis TaxID=2486016 RepID=A0ABW1RBR7_9LACO|nr:BREX system P-loop protein BrxC [Loigolactobacillus jiayinensis]